MHGWIDSNKNEQYITSLSVGEKQTPAAVPVGFGAGCGAGCDVSTGLAEKMRFLSGCILAVLEQGPGGVLRQGELGATGVSVGERGQGARGERKTRAMSSLLRGYMMVIADWSVTTVNDPDSFINVMLEQNGEMGDCLPWNSHS